jgi:cyclohexadieny/prephenate dehydrogenase
MMESIAILGLGLMGSSLGLALKKRGFTGEIRAFARREETRARALEIGVADTVFADPIEAVKGADLIVACVPIQTIPSLIMQCLPGLKKGAIVTDVGSTKTELMSAMSDSAVLFVGSHPIAGSEKAGVDAGCEDLYEGRLTVVTPPQDLPASALQSVCDLWEMTGSSVRLMDASEHDAMMACTSHLPHLVASALVRTVARKEDCATFSGTGFKDTTRVASGSAVVWRDIVATNCQPIIREVEALQKELGVLVDLLKGDDSQKIEVWLAEAAQKRNAILKEGNE